MRGQWNHRARVYTRKEYTIQYCQCKNQTSKIIIPGSLRAMCPDARIRGTSLGWVNRNSFTIQKTRVKTTAVPVVGDHSILQNIKLFHYKSMETMSQRPRAVTSSQISPISVWRWWPAMSRQITPPLSEREIKVRRGTFNLRHTHRSSESQHSFQAMLIYHRLKQRMCFFSHQEIERTGDGLVQRESYSKGQDSTLATCAIRVLAWWNLLIKGE